MKVSNVAFVIQSISKIKQLEILKNNRTDFNLLISESDSSVLKKINQGSKPLNKYCAAYFGIQTHDREKYVSEIKKNMHYEPIIDGWNIEPYNLTVSNEFINFIPSAIHSGGNETIYRQDRICIRQIGSVPIATFVPADIFTLNTIYNVYLKDRNSTNLKFILGIINSRVARFFWKKNSSDEKKTFPKIKKEAILAIPIPTVINTNEKLYNEIIKYVNTMLELNKQKQATTNSETLEQLDQRIAYNDDKINKLVYELYGLSEEEIGIMEVK